MQKLVHAEVEVIGAMARVKPTPYIKDTLTFTNTKGEQVCMYTEQHGMLLVPRGLVDANSGATDHRTEPWFEFLQSIAMPPRNEEQKKIISESLAYLKGGQDHVIEAPTGFGKTYLGAAIATKLCRKTLIVVTKTDLMKQWYDTLVNLIGVPPGHIGKAQQDTAVYVGKDYVLGMLHSLVIPGRYPKEFYQSFGMVVFDEVHKLGADTFQEVCKIFPAKHRLGLSATPKRWDGCERIFHAHIGPTLLRGTIVPMSPKVIVQQSGWKIPKGWQKAEDGQWVKTAMKVNPGKMMPIIKKLAQSADRNLQLARFVLSAYKTGRRVVVMSDLIENHLRPLFHVLAGVGIPGEDMDFYIGGRKDAELASAKLKRVVLATYSFTSEGTDVPEWDTLVMATPRSNVKQPIGRILRSMEGKKEPVIFDLVDADPIFQGFYQSREKQYFQVQGTIVKVKV